MENKWRNKNFKMALKNSMSGIEYTIKTQRNLKIQVICAIVAILLAVILKLTLIEWMILWMVIGSVLLAEIVNTAIEVMLDLYTQEYNETIKITKDIASGAVLISSMVSVIIGGILFLPKILN